MTTLGGTPNFQQHFCGILFTRPFPKAQSPHPRVPEPQLHNTHLLELLKPLQWTQGPCVSSKLLTSEQCGRAGSRVPSWYGKPWYRCRPTYKTMRHCLTKAGVAGFLPVMKLSGWWAQGSSGGCFWGRSRQWSPGLCCQGSNEWGVLSVVDRVIKTLVIVERFHSGRNKPRTSDYLGTVAMAT